ncbi:MAG TPA: GAF domain-containing protein, partial [Polyangiaceae bacterium]|nr:GAF domain-containing protein [Polyangiaceae bacterium]
SSPAAPSDSPARAPSLPPPAPILATLAGEPPRPAAPNAADVSAPEPAAESDGRLATAFEAMPDLYFLPTPVAGLEFTIQLLSRLLPCEAISTCLYDINTDEFRFVALTGPGTFERRAGAIPSLAGLFGAAKRERGLDVFVVPDAAAEPRYDVQVDGRVGLAARTLAYVPVRNAGQLLGMLQLINREDEKGFSQADVAILSYIGKQLGEFLAEKRALAE